MNSLEENSLLEEQGYSPAVTQETKAQAIRQALNGQRRLMTRAPDRVNIADVESVETVAERYIADCAVAGILPNMEGLCCVLGLSRAWVYQYLREKPNSESAMYINRLRMAWASLRISLAERQVLSAPMSIFLLKNSSMGFSDTPDNNELTPISPDPERPTWAYGMTEKEYREANIKRILESLPDLIEEDAPPGGD